MENEKTTYYFRGIPDYARIVSETIGFDITILPALNLIPLGPDTRPSKGSVADLMELSQNPQIDHIYVMSDYLFREDEHGDYYHDGTDVVDLCDETICLKPGRPWDPIYQKRAGQ